MPTRSSRRLPGRFPALSLLFLALLLTVPGRALAQTGMEMDADAVDSAPGLPEDWDVVLGWSGGVSVAPSASDLFHARVQDGASASVFSGASTRDDQPISSWQWTDTALLSDENLLDAFAAVYSGSEFYFGADRYGNGGNWDLGIWLLQTGIALDSGGTFTGSHVDGDVLFVVSIPNGMPAYLTAYRWVSDGTGSDGTLDDITASFSVPSGLFAATNASPACSPWPYTPQAPAACPGGCSPCFPDYSFLEGFADLSVLGSPCFRSMVVETRSSSSPTAALKDFVIVPISTFLQASLEVDGNAEDPSAGIPEDWDVVLGWSNGSSVTPSGSDLAHGFLHESSNETVFQGTRRDDDPISSWEWANGSTPSRLDLLDAFAAIYADGELYFGGDRYGNNDEWNVGVWLLQDQVTLGPGSGFSGDHRNGDVLLTAHAPLPGYQVDLHAYRWTSSGTGSLGNLDEITAQLPCGFVFSVNSTGPVCSPWPYTPQISGGCDPGCNSCFPIDSFIEGVVDLYALGLPCVRTVLVETRNSVNPDAALDDFIIVPLEVAGGPLVVDGDAEDTVSGPTDDWDVVLGWDNGSPVPPGGMDQAHRLQADPAGTTIPTGPNTRDDLDVSGWGWTDGPVPATYDLLDAFVAGYPDGRLYFGADRYGNAGNWAMGVWLLQNVVEMQVGGSFSAGHVVGDLLILIDAPLGFDATGTVYRWVGDGNGSNGNLDNVTSQFVVPCDLQIQVNPATTCSPWPYTPITPDTCPQGCNSCFPVYTFLEGYLNLGVQAPLCIKTVLVETRNSQTLTSGLRDFVIMPFDIAVSCGSTTGVDPVAVVPRPQLLAPHPNPFRAGTEIGFRLDTGSRVDLSVVRVDGSLVARLAEGRFPAGTWTRTWDGRDTGGRRVGAGVYFVQLRIGDTVASRRVVRLN